MKFKTKLRLYELKKHRELYYEAGFQLQDGSEIVSAFLPRSTLVRALQFSRSKHLIGLSDFIGCTHCEMHSLSHKYPAGNRLTNEIQKGI